MKSKYLIFAIGISLLFACNMDEDLFEVMPESDHIALDGMAEAYEHALIYNDSLSMCVEGILNCDATTMDYYDAMFHQFDEMFDDHHGNYSHNNISDDHHHNGDHNIRHGWMMTDDHGQSEHGNEDEHSSSDEHTYEHDMHSLEDMMHLRERHDEIHP